MEQKERYALQAAYAMACAAIAETAEVVWGIELPESKIEHAAVGVALYGHNVDWVTALLVRRHVDRPILRVTSINDHKDDYFWYSWFPYHARIIYAQ